MAVKMPPDLPSLPLKLVMLLLLLLPLPLAQVSGEGSNCLAGCGGKGNRTGGGGKMVNHRQGQFNL